MLDDNILDDDLAYDEHIDQELSEQLDINP